MTSPKSGVLLVDKPAGISSAAAVAKIRNKFRIKKIGHGGTLDPFASGLLVLLIGEGTKIARFLLAGEKQYEAEASTLFETDTEDLTGARTGDIDGPALSREELEKHRTAFTGRIHQVPPRYSALKKDGKPLYAWARKGVEITPEAREVEILSLALLDCPPGKFRFRVSASGGTYVRSLARDWARACGGTAHLTALRRLQSSQFLLANALPLETLLDSPQPPLVGVAEALHHLPRISCSSDLASKIRRGHPEARPALGDFWSFPPGYALAMDGNSPVAVISRAHADAEPNLERVFDPATL